MQTRRVVITGIGALTPIGNDIPAFWEGLSSGRSGANLITHFDSTSFKTKFACEVKGFNANDHLDRREARKMDPFCHYAMVATAEAMADANFNEDKLDKNRFGVIMGSGLGGINSLYNEIKSYVEGDGTPRFNPFLIPKMIVDIIAGHVSIRYGLKGPNYSSVSACATSTNCIIDAFLLIKSGYADVMLAGGSEAAIQPVSMGAFGSMKALSTNNENYTVASRPFDAHRDGFVMGEGAGTLVLELYEHAANRGAKIYAEVGGVGMSGDAHHITAPSADGDGAARVMQNVIDDAGLTPEDIDYVNVHGTSTPLGDISETQAIKRVFGEHASSVNISSTKSMTGHLLGAAGAVEAIASILAMQHQLVPPTINFEFPDPECDLNYTFNTPQARNIKTALSNTFGFGGHNASVLFKKL